MRKIDLLGCLSFVQKQLGVSGIKHIRVSGTCENMDALTQEFSKETGMPAKYVDFPSLLAIKSGDWGGYAALGAAVLPSNKQYNLDISVIDRVSHEELRTARTIMTMGAILASFLCLGGLSNMLSYKYRARELFVNDMKLTPEIKTIFAGKQSADIESMLQDMTTQLGILSGVARSKNQKLSVLFRQIIEAMPERVWLERINVTNPLLASNTLTGSIDLSGKAQDNTVSDEQALVFQFKENLLKHPILGKKYDITISVQGKASSGVMTGAAGGLDPKELAQKLEDRTSFNLRMTVKK
jgi:Tfp pilus assembly protein PilN